MELLFRISTGVAIALLGALVLYCFRLKQLYLVVPRMFGYGGLTGKGKLIELRAFNKGRSMEEEVHIDMPPNLTYELIAADHPDVQLRENKIALARLPSASDVSVILLAEGPVDVESFTPSVSSKTTKGKVFKKLKEVPPNVGNLVLFFISVVAFFAAAILIPSKVLEYQQHKEEKGKRELLAKYRHLEKEGWRGFENYISSEIRGSYSSFEFPITFTSAKRSGNTYEFSFFATNKTSSGLVVVAYVESGVEDNSPEFLPSKSVFDLPVGPMSSAPLVVSKTLPKGSASSDLYVKFTLRFGEVELWDIRFYPSQNSKAKKVLQPPRRASGAASGPRPVDPGRMEDR